MRGNARGYTLVELMVTVAVVATIAAVAVPSYRQYVMRANRADATAALLRLASAQEKFYLQNNTYATDAQMGDDPPAGLGITGTERGYYDLAIDGADAVGYTATATVVAGGHQEDDDDCQEFTVNEQGLRSADNTPGAGGTDTTDRCWR